MQCILCSNQEYKKIKNFIRSGDMRKVVECLQCGHIQLDPISSAEHSQLLYDENKEAKDVFENVFDNFNMDYIKLVHEHDAERRLKFISKLDIKNSDHILEIGSGEGVLVNKLLLNGYTVDGLEISKERRSLCKKYFKINLLSNNFQIDEVPPSMKNKYDIIMGFHVFQCFNDPRLLIQRLKLLLKDGGKVIFEVSNYNDYMLNCKSYNDFHFHDLCWSYYKPSILQNFFVDSGFVNVQIHYVQRYSFVNAVNWLYKGKPQISQTDRPIYDAVPELHWLEQLYKRKLVDTKTTDTIVLVASLKTG
jgi:cyclopropane fatty-acyl-phospholipid synthase-like methyltransferase